MTTIAMPTDPTQLPCGPDKVDIHVVDLTLSATWSSGSTHLVSLVSNPDLGVILGRGQRDHTGAATVPHDTLETGMVAVCLGVDGGDHDEVHFDPAAGIDPEEVLGQAIEALVMCRDALKRVRLA